jgi:hypothetical protein
MLGSRGLKLFLELYTLPTVKSIAGKAPSLTFKPAWDDWLADFAYRFSCVTGLGCKRPAKSPGAIYVCWPLLNLAEVKNTYRL